MKRFFLVPLVAVTLLQLAGIAAASPQKKKTSRASKKLPYKAKVPGVDPTMGDNVDGDDLVVRRAAVAALGTFAGSVVVVDPTNGRILSMVNQRLALKTGFVPCSTIKLVTALAALTEGVVSKNTTIFTGRYVSYNLTQALARSNNQYFNILGTRLGFDRVHHYAEMLGLGEKAGLDIPGEQPGFLPLEAPKNGGVGMMTSFGTGISHDAPGARRDAQRHRQRRHHVLPAIPANAGRRRALHSQSEASARTRPHRYRRHQVRHARRRRFRHRTPRRLRCHASPSSARPAPVRISRPPATWVGSVRSTRWARIAWL